MNAGPWLPVPPRGYGGIENVIAALVPPLRRLGVRVILATVKDSTLEADERIHLFNEGQFGLLQRPYNQVSGIAHAHQQAVIRVLQARTDIDLVHDHLEVVGLSTLAAMGPATPPVLHTLHWDLAKHPELYRHFHGGGRVWVNGVSASQLARAPQALRDHSVGYIHLATPLAVHADQRPVPVKNDYLVMLSRITPAKGQHIGVRLAHQVGFSLILAGPVGPYRTPAALAAARHDPAALQNPDVRYWYEQVAPYVDDVRVRWIGTVAGRERDALVAGAQASLFPLQWEEPGGTAVVESLALGTPVVGLARGCLPELITHEDTGLLTDNPEELPDLILAASKLDPRRCLQEAARRFTPAVMAERYLQLYQRVRQLSGEAPQPARPAQPG